MTRALAAAVALLAVVAACAGQAAPPSTAATSAAPTSTGAPPALEPAAPPPWLELGVSYSPRHSVGLRRLDVVTENSGPDDIVVSLIRLDAEHFAPVPPDEKNSIIRSGSRVDVKAFFGEVADCGAAGPLEATVHLELRIGEDPGVHRYDIPLDPAPLDRIRLNECEEMAARRAVAVSFGESWEADGTTMRTTLIYERGEGDEPIAVAEIRGMILFSARPAADGDGMVGHLEPGRDRLEVPVELVLARCDVHAVSQAPDGYAFRTWVSVRDLEPRLLTVLPQPELEAALRRIVDDCVEERGGTAP